MKTPYTLRSFVEKSLYLMVLLGLTTWTGCRDDMSKSVSAVMNDLDRCPRWTNAEIHDPEKNRRLFECLENLSRQPTVVLRKGIERFVFELPANSTNLDELSKIFVLNRYLFAVPSKIPAREARFFAGWMGVPFDGETVDLLWPLIIDKAGRFDVTGTLGAYNGEAYQPLAEFDYFHQRFDRRPGQPR